MTKTLASLAVAAALAACGNPLADGSYKGQPLIELHGRIGSAASDQLLSHPTVGLVWRTLLDGGQVSTPDGALGVPSLIGELEPVSWTSFPATFDFKVFNAPPPQAMIPAPGGPPGAWASIVAVDDVNGDGTFALTDVSVPYECSTDGGCVPPTGNWVAVVNSAEELDSTGTILRGSLLVVEVAPPDLLLATSPDLFLIYGTDNASGMASASDAGNSAAARPGYFLMNLCQIACGASCVNMNAELLAPSTVIDLGPVQTTSLSSIPECRGVDAGACAQSACPLYCNAEESSLSSPPSCECRPQSNNVSYKMGAPCTSDADCCTGLCNQVGGAPGLCGPSTPDGTACSPTGCSTTLVNQAAEVPLTWVASPPPFTFPASGLPPAGTYLLTAATGFSGFGGATGQTGDTYQETVVIGALQDNGGVLVTGVSNDNGCVNALTATLTLTGDTFGTGALTLDACAGGATALSVWGYTLNAGSPTTFQLSANGDPAIVLTYTLQ